MLGYPDFDLNFCSKINKALSHIYNPVTPKEYGEYLNEKRSKNTKRNKRRK